MFERTLGPILLQVEHRAPGSEGGPTLRVRRLADGRELLRFDCFARGRPLAPRPGRPRRRSRPSGRSSTPSSGPSPSCAATCRATSRAPAGPPLAAPPAEIGEALEAAEGALRHPPYDFDAVDPALKRTSRGEKWTVVPADALPLWVADMDFAGRRADPPRAPARGRPLGPRLPDPPGAHGPAGRLRRARARRFGWEVETRRVEILTDVMQGVYVGLQQLSEPGDGVVVQTPIYAPFLRAVEETGRRLAENPLVQGSAGYEIDLDGLRRAAAGARVLLLCHPHNPSGPRVPPRRARGDRRGRARAAASSW